MSSPNNPHPYLPHSPYPLGIFGSFIAKQQESLILKEKVRSLSGDSFSIKTVDGRALLQVQGDVFSMSGRKAVVDMQGNHLFTIRKRRFSIPPSFYAEDAQGNRFLDVDGKFRLFSSKSHATFTNLCTPTPQPEQLSIKGNYLNTHADITNDRTDRPVARIDRKIFNARELLGGSQTYLVNVAQGVDIALIVAMCICLDEARNE